MRVSEQRTDDGCNEASYQAKDYGPWSNITNACTRGNVHAAIVFLKYVTHKQIRNKFSYVYGTK